jgi:hypothetical protein
MEESADGSISSVASFFFFLLLYGGFSLLLKVQRQQDPGTDWFSGVLVAVAVVVVDACSGKDVVQ